MNTLTYGQKIPETGDRGDALYQAFEDNFTRTDGHTHDGVDSPLLTGSAFVGVPLTILAAAWVASGATGHYRQLVTVPTGFDFDTAQISFRTTAGAFIYPTVERASSTTFYVYTSDNSINFVAVFGG